MNFQMNCFARRLVLTQRQKGNRKCAIKIRTNMAFWDRPRGCIPVSVFIHFSKEIFEIKRRVPSEFDPPTFRLTAERADRLRHGDLSVYERVV